MNGVSVEHNIVSLKINNFSISFNLTIAVAFNKDVAILVTFNNFLAHPSRWIAERQILITKNI